MKAATAANLKAHLADFLKQAQHEPVIITKYNTAVGVLMADEAEMERLLLANSPTFRALRDKSCHQIEQTGGIPQDQFWREVAAESREDAKKRKCGVRKPRRTVS